MTTEKTENSGKKFSRTKATPSMELFKNQKVQVPDFISTHHIFNTPNRLRKIFPSIGIPNFKEEAAMAIPAIDLKRGDNFVSLLIKQMHQGLIAAQEALNVKIDMAQFGFAGEADSKVIDDMSTTLLVIDATKKQLNLNNGVIDKVVQSISGKIALKLYQDIIGPNEKIIHKKDVAFFSLFSKFKEKFREWNIPFFDLEGTKEFKVFNTENIPNKKYSVIFSSGGEEGAWDILTMSMRGIKSCQSWENQYPRCLVGSVISKYVGIIYLTSGADHEGFGPKMIRRCIVRYVIDAVDRKPCILIDKMYMEEHSETVKLFIETLQKRTNIPVYFSPRLTGKLRHLYVPYEHLRGKVSEKEWSYQDIALKTEIDLKIHTLSNNNIEGYSRLISTFQNKLISSLADAMRSNYDAGRATTSPEILRLMTSIRMESGYDRCSQTIINDILSNIIIDTSPVNGTPKEQFKRYLTKLILLKKEIRQLTLSHLQGYFADFIIDSNNKIQIGDLICNSIQTSLKNELKQMFSV